jgi:Fe-S-cluster containining protein
VPATPKNFVRFECQRGCTKCCERKGFVYLSEQDVENAAAFLGLTKEEFESKHVYRTKNLRRLRTPRNSTCRFLKDGGCSIHAVKPTQCRLFPFWPPIIESKSEWRYTAEWCPGIGKGPLIQIDTAIEAAGEMKEAYPGFFD